LLMVILSADFFDASHFRSAGNTFGKYRYNAAALNPAPGAGNSRAAKKHGIISVSDNDFTPVRKERKTREKCFDYIFFL